MCFSASASFTVSAGLIPVGIYCLYRICQHPLNIYWPFALYPLIFGIQQGVEGWLWLMIKTGDAELIRLPALGFVFFSHFFWLLWIPYSCYKIETTGYKKRLFAILALMGSVLGLVMLIPVLLFADWMTVSVIHHSISYELKLIVDDYIPRIVVRGAYVLIILIPLLLSSHQYIRNFGMIILLSVVLVVFLSAETFISVWCFFAALTSLYMLYMLNQLAKQATDQGLTHKM